MSLDGFDALRKLLQELPETLAAEAGPIVVATAQTMASLQRTAYPLGPTGNLRNGVTVIPQTSRVGSRVVVKSASPHAIIFEKGTAQRQTRTGANRGRMPVASETQQMIPRAIRARKQMYEALTTLLTDHGFEVSA